MRRVSFFVFAALGVAGAGVAACGSILGLPDGLDFSDAVARRARRDRRCRRRRSRGHERRGRRSRSGRRRPERERRRRGDVRPGYQDVRRPLRRRRPELRMLAIIELQPVPLDEQRHAHVRRRGRVRPRVRAGIRGLRTGRRRRVRDRRARQSGLLPRLRIGMHSAPTLRARRRRRAGRYVTDCAMGTIECDGGCVATATSPANCGGCGVACPPPAARRPRDVRRRQVRHRVPRDPRRLQSRRVGRLRDRYERRSDQLRQRVRRRRMRGARERDDVQLHGRAVHDHPNCNAPFFDYCNGTASDGCECDVGSRTSASAPRVSRAPGWGERAPTACPCCGGTMCGAGGVCRNGAAWVAAAALDCCSGNCSRAGQLLLTANQ